MIFLSSQYDEEDYKFDIKWLSKEIIREKMKLFESNNEVLIKMVVKVYDELIKEYNSRYKVSRNDDT